MDDKTESKRTRCDRLYTALHLERATYIPLWRELADFILPRRYRLDTQDRNRGDRRNSKIVDSTATLSARTLRSGMHAGASSPARPWFRLITPDEKLNEFWAVKVWLHIVTDRLRTMFMRSNLYNALPIVYGDEGVFGTGAMLVVEDEQDLMRCYPMQIGTYMAAINDRSIVDTCIRELAMTVRQVVRRFVRRQDGTLDWSKVSRTVKSLWDRGSLDQTVEVEHFIMANTDYDGMKQTAKFKRFSSLYVEKGSTQPDFLRESGFDEFPVLMPRWDVSGEDVFGTGCPGIDAVGDIKALQILQKRKAEAIEKMVRPPMVGPSSLKSAKASILPGDITYVDIREGQQTFKPVYEVQPRVSELVQDIAQHQSRISRAFYEDLFIMLTMSDRREITAREVDERHEEKLLMLGPTLERQNDELFDPLIDRAFAIAMRVPGLIPPPPLELRKQELRVEYISIMAQAQKMVGIGGIDRFTGFVGTIGKVIPSAMDKFNTDAAIDMYAEMTGVPPAIVRSKDEVASIRKDREQQAQQASQSERMAQASQTAANLSKAKLDEDNALSRIVDSEQEAA